MSFIWAAISGALSGLVQGFLSLFGLSTAQKLGRAEVKLAGDEKLLQEVKKADDTDALDNRIGDSALRVQLGKFKRPD
jgi:hypothetical protein